MPGTILYSSFPDEALVDLYSEGDNRAFNTLVARHSPAVKYYLLNLLGDRDDAEDVLQDICEFMVRYFRRGRYQFHKSFHGWLNEVVFRNAMRFLKKRNRYDKMRMEVMQLAETDARSRVVRPVKDSELFRAIKKLSEKEQVVIRLHFFSKKTIEEIAAALKLSVGTARSRYCRALVKLYGMLIKPGGMEPSY